MTDTPSLADALAHSDRLYDRIQIQRAIARMAANISADDVGTHDADARPLYLTVMHGGMLFAAELALALGEQGLDLQFDYLHATRYRGAITGAELHWKHRPDTSLRNRRVLLVDDIVDEGHTLAAVRDWCRDQGAGEVRIAAMAVKRHARCVPGLAADYVGVEVPDRYVYGYGMDYHEQGRNLPAIYALKEQA